MSSCGEDNTSAGSCRDRSGDSCPSPTHAPPRRNSSSSSRSDESCKVKKENHSLFWKCILTINAILHIPMYAMLICLLSYFFLLYVSPAWLRSLLIAYLAYVIFDTAPSNGGWDEDTAAPFSLLRPLFPKLRWRWRRFWRTTKHVRMVADYFDMELVKTADLDPKRNYLFVHHPHGVIAMGFNTALSTNGCGFEEKFPGIHRSGATLNVTFRAPFYREWLLMIGFISASKENLVRQLTTAEPFRKSVVLVPGGAQEALHAHPSIFHVYLRKRKGFVRLALQTGCSVVPCLGFGENEIFGTVYGEKDAGGRDSKNLLFVIQSTLLKYMSFSLPIITNFVPLRRKIAVIVGEPMHFEKTENPTPEMVDKYHNLYIENLCKLYERYKGQYGIKGVEMEIL